MYDNVLHFTDGTNHTLEGRERPSILFDSVTGAPTHLYNGAIPYSAPWYSMVQAVGSGGSGRGWV